ncbi:MAG: Rpn family recombination-promoting nuclease/putative transposase [Phormidium tanganyikae FI6-MK23]|nr:Rpn family recombination-promoting nuclease/putative transposase [Phormidium tanganyikae FI6-MK23]
MKTDSIFYRIFQTTPNTFFELIGESDPRMTTYAFGSQEIKQTSFRLDGIFLPPLRLTGFPIYFVEAQAYSDKKGENFYARFFGEIHLYLKDYQPVNNWRAVVIFTEKRFDPGIPAHYSEYENNPRVQRIYLNKLPSDVGDLSLGLGVLQLLGMSQK